MTFQKVKYKKMDKKTGLASEKEAFEIMKLPEQLISDIDATFKDKVRIWFDPKQKRLLAVSLGGKKLTPEQAKQKLEDLAKKEERYQARQIKLEADKKRLLERVNGS